MDIPKRITSALLSAAAGGVTPRVGLYYIQVGRKKEIEIIQNDLDNIAEGGACFRFVIGRYGSGKSFLLQTIRNYAMDRGFVVADTDLSADKRLVGGNSQGLATYRALVANISTKVRRDGGALPAILEKWLSAIYSEVLEANFVMDTPEFFAEVKKRIYLNINEIEGLVHGLDLAKVLGIYFEAYIRKDSDTQNAALKWLRGEYNTKREAREALDINDIVTDDNWYDYIKLLCAFVKSIGYLGLCVMIDEGAYLYQISNSVSRHNNYEMLLTMFNDTMQGRVNNLLIYFGGTPQFLEDTRRGLFSYDALATRLRDSRFVKMGYSDINSPVIRLPILTHEEIFALLTRLNELHMTHYGHTITLSPQQITTFMQQSIDKIGADTMLTPRELTRDFVSLLNIMHDQNVPFDELVKAAEKKSAQVSDESATFEL